MMKKYFSVLATLLITNVSHAGVDMDAMHKQLNIMNNIFKTSLNEIENNGKFRVSDVDSLYLAGQGVVFTVSSGGHFTHWSGDNFTFITAPPAPVAPVIEQEIIGDVDVDEIVIRTMEAQTHQYESAMEAMEHARELARELRDEQRDVTYELRDIERELRDKKYQEKRVVSDKEAAKEIKIEIKALEKEKQSLIEQKKVLTQKNRKQDKALKDKKAKQQAQRVEYNKQLHAQFSDSLCSYGNSLKALPKTEKVSLVIKRGGETVHRRTLDKVIIFNKSDVLQCVIDNIDAKQLLSKATHYSF